MEASGEDYNNELDASMPENTDTQQQQGQDDDLGGGPVEKRWPGWPGESVFRILVPSQKVGGIIGRKGEFIKKMCEETRARIKILDGPPGTQERAVLISAKEEPDAPLPPAIDGLLRVHKRIADGLDSDLSNAPPNTAGTILSRFLVGATQAGSLIGKQGATIKSIQEASNCIIRVLGQDDLPVFALEDDRIVEVQGEASGVHKAVELIASHLRKFLVDRSVIGIFEMQMQNPHPQMDYNAPPPHQSWGPQGFPPNAGGGPGFGPQHAGIGPGFGPQNAGGGPGFGSQHAGGGPGFGSNPQYMMPPRQHDNYYPPADLPPMEKQPHQGLSMYGRDASIGVHSSANAQPPQAIISQITQHMQVPLSYADAVIGNAGANISYIRRASGASITIQETRGVPGEMTVEINGTGSQVQTAQQLIQNFMAEAASSQQNHANGPAENVYASHGSVYSSPPSNTGHAGQDAGSYGSNYNSSYGNNYGNSYGY
ncbi:hypothetical protein AQUCO_04900046v1 [Aquilegia coerulea]|uniref:K Homology domain-containing protein n=2 Tax=Aquilegia coerulea TaxID=218851 RepID=A0A2G5CJJ3_AQUCA|nr:hypothetical protein AQUCO_04900046v1 [Aquilegia coerulea]